MLNSEDNKYVEEQHAKLEADKQAADAAAAEEAEAKIKGKGSITYKLSGGSDSWPEDRKKRIVAAMDEGVAFYNKNSRFKKELTANDSPGTPLNQDTESSPVNDLRHIKMVEAIRKDMGMK